MYENFNSQDDLIKMILKAERTSSSWNMSKKKLTRDIIKEILKIYDL